MSESIDLEFLDQKITLKTKAMDPELVHEVVSLASLKLEEAEKRIKGNAAHQVALLALLDMTEEYVRSKRKVMEYRIQFQKKSAEILELVSTELK